MRRALALCAVGLASCCAAAEPASLLPPLIFTQPLENASYTQVVELCALRPRELSKEELERKTTNMQDTQKNEGQKIEELRAEIADNKKEYKSSNEEYKHIDSELTELKTKHMQLKKTKAGNDKDLQKASKDSIETLVRSAEEIISHERTSWMSVAGKQPTEDEETSDAEGGANKRMRGKKTTVAPSYGEPS